MEESCLTQLSSISRCRKLCALMYFSYENKNKSFKTSVISRYLAVVNIIRFVILCITKTICMSNFKNNCLECTNVLLSYTESKNLHSVS